MNNGRLKKIILEEIYKLLKEDTTGLSTGEMTDSERQTAKYDANQEYSSNAIKNIMITWLQQLTPVKYRQLYEDLANLAQKDGVNINKTGSVITNIWADTKMLIDKWSKQGNKLNDVRLMNNVYYSLRDKAIANAFSRSGLVFKGNQE